VKYLPAYMEPLLAYSSRVLFKPGRYSDSLSTCVGLLGCPHIRTLLIWRKIMNEQLACRGGKPVRKPFLVFGSPAIEEEDVAEVVDSLRSGWLGTGPKVARFEMMFREYVNARYAVAVNSCTAALHLSLLAAGIGAGDEVITTPMTFCATVNTILHVGAQPVFVDVRKETMNINPELIEQAITPRTRVLLPVHFAGRPCEMDAITAIARKHGLLVIEDAAHCIEGWFKGRKIGSIGDATCFSFYVTKNIVTGEGGMVTTPHEEWASKIKVYALHGMTKDAWARYSDQGFKHYQVVAPGFKYNMMDIQASLGIQQLKRIRRYACRREEIWERYDRAFADLPAFLPAPPQPETVHARHLYTLLLDLDNLTASRDEVLAALHAENIGCGVHYIGLHLHDYYRLTFDFQPEDFPNATFISERTISIPFSAKLADQDVEDVISAVRKVLKAYTR
jgi:dTDP-4-amino-4,6-dideoxygalactose transaminase